MKCTLQFTGRTGREAVSCWYIVLVLHKFPCAAYPIVFIKIMCTPAKCLPSYLVLKQIEVTWYNFTCLIFQLNYDNNPVLAVYGHSHCVSLSMTLLGHVHCRSQIR